MADSDRPISGEETLSLAQPSTDWDALIIDDTDATLSLGTSVESVSAGLLPQHAGQGESTRQTAAADVTAIMDELIIKSDSQGQNPPSSPSFNVHTRFNQAVDRGLNILDVLGRGGMGVALRARQEGLARDVAIKVLHKNGAQGPANEALHREARLTADLDHPGVIPIHQAGFDFFCMRLVRGQTLRALYGDQPLEGEALFRFVGHLARLAEAVAFAHHRGIIHRDIKPSNVMVGEHDEVLLLDWGLALRGQEQAGRWQSAELVKERACAGTPQYLPPESALARPELIGPACDVFLLGGLLYQALSGRPPYCGKSVHKILTQAAKNHWTPLSELRADVSPALVGLQEQAMAGEPSKRPDAAGLAASLHRWLHERQVAQRAEQALAAARGILASLSLPDAAGNTGQVYADCDRSRRHCQAAEALIGRAAAVERVMQEIALTEGRQALAVGDLGLARVCVEQLPTRDADQEMADLVAALALAERARQQARRRLRIMAVAALLLLSSGLISLIVSTRYALDSEARLASQRQEQAQQLLIQAQELPADDLAGRQLLLHQGLGYDAEHSHLRSLLTETSLELAWQSLAGGDLNSAAYLAEDLQALGESAEKLLTALAQAIEERDAEALAEQQRRHQILQRIADDPLLPIDAELVQEVAGWDGREYSPALGALLEHPRLAVRLFVIQVLTRSKEGWRGEELLVQAAQDEESVLRLAAWRTLGLHDYPLSAATLAELLAGLDGDVADADRLPGMISRSHAALLGRQQRQVLATAGQRALQAGSYRRALALLLWAGQATAVIELVQQHLPDDPQALALAARLAWWQVHDRQQAQMLAGQLRQAQPGLWEGWHLGWHLALVEKNTDWLQNSIAEAQSIFEEDARLLVWRAVMGDSLAEQQVGRQLTLASGPLDSAQPLALRLVQQRQDHSVLLRRARNRQHIEQLVDNDWLTLLHEIYDLRWSGRATRALSLAAILAEYRPEDQNILDMHYQLLVTHERPTAPLFAQHSQALTALIAGGAP